MAFFFKSYDINIDYFYYNNMFENYILYLFDDEYYIDRYEFDYYNQLYPCQESINLGTDEKPVYSCTKCYQLNKNKKDNDNNIFTKIINPNNNLSFCFNHEYYNLYNCTEAINRTINGNEKYDCVKCAKNNILMYNGEKDVHYCQFIIIIQNQKNILLIIVKLVDLIIIIIVFLVSIQIIYRIL